MGLSGIFDRESAFGKACGKIGSIIVVNLLFVLTLIPVVTAGAGLCAMYYCMMSLRLYEDISPVRDFWKAFKQNFRQGTICWSALLFAGILLFVDYRIAMFMTGSTWVGTICQVVVGAVSLIVLLIGVYLFPVMAAFDGRIRDAVRNSVFFVGKNVAVALIITALTIVPMFLSYVFFQYMPLFAFIWCLCGFAAIAYINSLMLVKMFKAFLNIEEDAEETKSEDMDNMQTLEDMKRLGF